MKGAAAISELTDTNAEIVPLADGFRIYAVDPGRLAQDLAVRARERGIRITGLNTLVPSLEEVFLHITTRAEGTTPQRARANVL